MLFITIVLILITFHALVKGKAFRKLMLDMHDYEEHKHEKGKELPDKELIVRVFGFIVYSLVFLIVYLVYLIKAIGIDPYTYPSIIMLAWYILSYPYSWIITANEKKGELGKAKKLKRLHTKRTFLGTIGNIIALTYFVYMFIVLTNLI